MKGICSTPKAWIESTGEEKRTKNDELEASLVSSWEPSDKNIDGKEWRDFPSMKGYLNKKSRSLKKQGVGGRENKDNLGRLKQTPLRKLRGDLGNVENDRIHLKRSTPVEKKLRWQTRRSRRYSIHIGIWEHRLGKVWIQHLTSKQLEYHNSKQNKRFGLQNKPEQMHMIEFTQSHTMHLSERYSRSYLNTHL